MMLSLDTAYRSFGGEVEASSTPTICRLSDSRRHQLSAIALPRYVRLILRDRATGADLLGEADFAIRANAPAACGRSDAAVACLSVAPSVQSDASEAERQAR